MATDGQLEIELDNEKPVDFLLFLIRKSNEGGKYRVTAGLKDGMDKKKYGKWKCYVVIGYSAWDARDANRRSRPSFV